jgi:hypothetical protein
VRRSDNAAALAAEVELHKSDAGHSIPKAVPCNLEGDALELHGTHDTGKPKLQENRASVAVWVAAKLKC